MPGSAALPSAIQNIDGVTLQGELGTTTVEDNRGDSNGAWDVYAQSTDIVRDDGNATISAALVGYVAGQIDTQGAVTIQVFDRDNIQNAPNVVKATGVFGANSATWNPTLVVPLPIDTPAGNYSATISQSVS